MPSDLIYREDAKDYARHAIAKGLNVLEYLDEVPAADFRPVVSGKWIPDYDYEEYDYDGSTPLPEPRKFQDGWQCSLCGGYMPSKTNYCPNCGAKMEG